MERTPLALTPRNGGKAHPSPNEVTPTKVVLPFTEATSGPLMCLFTGKKGLRI